MSERQLRGVGAVVVTFLAAALVIGTAWRAAASGPYKAAASSALPSEPSRAIDVDEIRHLEIPTGWRAEQVAGALERSGIGDGERFLWFVRHPRQAGVADELAARPSLEGYLAPGIYDLRGDFSERRFVVEMTRRFEEMLEPKYRRQATRRQLSLNTVVTLASIIQREMLVASEAPVIAAVYWNRLRAGMTLSADPTVIYALDGRRASRRPYWAHGLARRDLRIASPYNTYLHRGLPPGPIASPGEEAVAAVLFPADLDYRFFVARGNGTHVFAATGREHLANVERYRGTQRPGRQPTPSDLQQLVERLMQPVDGHVGVVVKNLATGEEASLNASEFFTSASLYKLAVLLTAFERRREGRLAFGERLSISARISAEDYPELQTLLGRTPTVRKALREMVIRSSNAAGVTLLNKFGRDAIDRLLQRNGVRATSLASLRIVTTPRDVARLLELIATGRAVSRQASAQMLELLLRQQINDRLPRYLPKHVRLAHKTGTLNYPSHDAGILFTQRGPVVIVAMTEDASRPSVATESIARLGRLVYDYFTSYAPAAARVRARGNPACASNPFRAGRGGPLAGRTIMLDPGHGGTDPGATFTFRDGLVLREKDLASSVVLRLKDLLLARGATVYLTRCRDVNVPQIERAAYANSVRPDLLIAIHLNASNDPEVDGTEISYFLPDGKVLASYLLGKFTRPGLWETLSAGGPIANRGLHQRPSQLLGARSSHFSQLVASTVPAALTEAIYLTNPEEAADLRAKGGRRLEQIARGHLRGILNYFGAAHSSPGKRSAWPKRPPPAPLAAQVTIVVTGAVVPGARVPRGPEGDVVLGNLRGAVGSAGARELREAGFTVLDLGERSSSLDERASTVSALDRAGLVHTGRPWQMARQQAGPIRVAVIGLPARAGSPRVLGLRAAQRLVRRADTWADVVVVRGESLEAGVQYALIDAGADLVVDGARGVPAPEWYRGRLIAHGLDGLFGENSVLRVRLGANGTWLDGQLLGRSLGVRTARLAPPRPAKAPPKGARVADLSPRAKAALLVVSGLPAPEGVGGVIVQRWSRHIAYPPDTLVFADQEGAPVNALPALPPRVPAAAYDDPSSAFKAGAETGRALRRAGIQIDLAPVLDAWGGPLGGRHFRNPSFGLAFARGLVDGGTRACPKHFPGLGSTRVSTDRGGSVRGVVERRELAGFRAAIRERVSCVMMGHAVYRKLGSRPASLEHRAYRLLRSLGFEGVVITDDLDVLGRADAARSALSAVRAGADLVLFTSGQDAKAAIDALVPLARRGLLDSHVERVLRLRGEILR